VSNKQGRDTQLLTLSGSNKLGRVASGKLDALTVDPERAPAVVHLLQPRFSYGDSAGVRSVSILISAPTSADPLPSLFNLLGRPYLREYSQNNTNIIISTSDSIKMKKLRTNLPFSSSESE
jgi:hypothetical protein